MTELTDEECDAIARAVGNAHGARWSQIGSLSRALIRAGAAARAVPREWEIIRRYIRTMRIIDRGCGDYEVRAVDINGHDWLAEGLSSLAYVLRESYEDAAPSVLRGIDHDRP